LAVGLSAVNTHDSVLLEPMVDAVPAIKGPRGRPSCTVTRGMTIRAVGGRCAGGGSARGLRGVASSRATSWAVTGMWWSGRWRRCFGYRRLRVRYERRADILLGFCYLACALICLKSLHSPKS
jgi:hypothetical protein